MVISAGDSLSASSASMDKIVQKNVKWQSGGHLKISRNAIAANKTTNCVNKSSNKIATSGYWLAFDVWPDSITISEDNLCVSHGSPPHELTSGPEPWESSRWFHSWLRSKQGERMQWDARGSSLGRVRSDQSERLGDVMS